MIKVDKKVDKVDRDFALIWWIRWWRRRWIRWIAISRKRWIRWWIRRWMMDKKVDKVDKKADGDFAKY